MFFFPHFDKSVRWSGISDGTAKKKKKEIYIVIFTILSWLNHIYIS